MKIPYISKSQLEQQSFDLYQKALSNDDTEKLPVNVENIVEFTLEYNLNLAASLPTRILGASDWETRFIQISESITHNGRRRFTIAHEIAHVVLHFPYLEAHHNSQPSLSLSNEVAIFQDDRSEFQADYFAGALLMPAKLMMECYGEKARQGLYINADEVAATFDVSEQAAAIRLKTLEMVLGKVPEIPLNFNL